MTAKIISLFDRKRMPSSKRRGRRRRRKDKAHMEVLQACADTGPPDIALLDQVIEDLYWADNVTDTDILAIYLYRRKAKP
jgi:hypothetical protein